MKPPLVTCPCCHGTGQAPMTQPLVETLAILTQRPISTADIYAAVPGRDYFGITAINNRLNKLQKMGFVASERRGKEFFWRKTK